MRPWAASPGELSLGTSCSFLHSSPVSAPSNTGITIFPSGQRLALPAVSGPTLTGEQLRLASDRGHVIVLTFWGSWCSVCQYEAPELAAAAREFAPSGVRFVGVDVADNPASGRAFQQYHGMRYPSLSEPGDHIASELNQIIPITDFPSALVITSDGRIAGRVIGVVSRHDLRRLIKAAR